jgi:hypothetical protein
VDLETRRKKQQALMVQLVERRVRLRAEQLYHERGQEDGKALEDWVKAETEVLENNIVAPLYYRVRATGSDAKGSDVPSDFSATDPASWESPA